MRPNILNREFQHPADGWYQIETPGKHLNKEAGVLQVIDDTAVNSIVNRFNQEADDYKRKNGKPFPGMVIDHEHFKHQADKETRAYGWLMRLENRGGIPFGQIDWTNTGKPAIDGGDYRYFSTEYDPRDLVVLNKGQKPMRIRPMRLDGLSLTNAPNNIGGAPITNRLKNGAIAIPKHHNFDSDEEYLAAAKKNQQTIAIWFGSSKDCPWRTAD
jgi:phage I-like protein